MKLQSIYTKKQRYISKEMQNNTGKLLGKIHSEAEHKVFTDYFEISEIRGLKIQDAFF